MLPRNIKHHYFKMPKESVAYTPDPAVIDQLHRIDPRISVYWWSKCKKCGAEYPGDVVFCDHVIEGELMVGGGFRNGYLCGGRQFTGFWGIYVDTPVYEEFMYQGRKYIFWRDMPVLQAIAPPGQNGLRRWAQNVVAFRRPTKHDLNKEVRQMEEKQAKVKAETDDDIEQETNDWGTKLAWNRVTEAITGKPAIGSFVVKKPDKGGTPNA